MVSLVKGFFPDGFNPQAAKTAQMNVAGCMGAAGGFLSQFSQAHCSFIGKVLCVGAAGLALNGLFAANPVFGLAIRSSTDTNTNANTKANTKATFSSRPVGFDIHRKKDSQFWSNLSEELRKTSESQEENFKYSLLYSEENMMESDKSLVKFRVLEQVLQNHEQDISREELALLQAIVNKDTQTINSSIKSIYRELMVDSAGLEISAIIIRMQEMLTNMGHAISENDLRDLLCLNRKTNFFSDDMRKNIRRMFSQTLEKLQKQNEAAGNKKQHLQLIIDVKFEVIEELKKMYGLSGKEYDHVCTLWGEWQNETRSFNLDFYLCSDGFSETGRRIDISTLIPPEMPETEGK